MSFAYTHGCAAQALPAGLTLDWPRGGVVRLHRAAWAAQPAARHPPCSAAAPQSFHVVAAIPLTWRRATTRPMRWAVDAAVLLAQSALAVAIVIIGCGCSAEACAAWGLLQLLMHQLGPCCSRVTRIPGMTSTSAAAGLEG